MEVLKAILENSQYAALTAFIVGLMTALSPCPLATNISAMGFIGKDITEKKRIFISGLAYTGGRTVSYTLLALLIYSGASQINLSRFLQGWGERILAPVLILIGLVMLDIIKMRFPGFSGLAEKVGGKGKYKYLGAFLLGIIFALAFCPYSGVLYFAILIPLTIKSAGGLFLPVLFAVATGLPVIIFAWLLAYAVGSVGKLYNRIRSFEIWVRRSVGILFIASGIYLLLRFLLPVLN